MPWTNAAVTLYHGTDEQSAKSIKQAAGDLKHGIKLSMCKIATDFGPGFYTTTNKHQACNWANTRVRSLPSRGRASVLKFEIARDDLAILEDLVFTRKCVDFYHFVAFCRASSHPAARSNGRAALRLYDVIYGPVSMWPQHLVVEDADQISFHTSAALAKLSDVKDEDVGNPTFAFDNY